MLMQPTLEKLYSMKLMGMAEAIRRQADNPESAQLTAVQNNSGYVSGALMELGRSRL